MDWLTGLKGKWSDKNEVSPSEVSKGSHKKAWWVCIEAGHEWEAVIKNVVNGSGCPVCAGRLIIPGVNDLATRFPELAKEWSPRNGADPATVSPGDRKKVWWVGACGHEWEQGIQKRTARGQGCVYCAKAGTTLLPGFNDLETKFPEVAREWSNRNVKTASEVFPASAKRYWWVCSLGHEWESSVANRTHNKAGCPYCASNPKVLAGFNDLPTTHPELLKEWSKRNTLQPEQLTFGTTQKVWWTCELQHEWEAIPNSRVRGFGCPVCAGKTALPGFNDLATARPEVAALWDFDSNDNRTPSDVTVGSSYRARWVCPKNHKWQAAVVDLTRGDGRETGCPSCSAQTFVSRGETELAEFLERFVPVETSFRSMKGVHEIDIAIPSLKIGVEFNGLYWHTENRRGRDYHFDKLRSVNEQGWDLIQVWEDDWKDRRAVVERMLKRKLGVSDEPRKSARALEYRSVEKEEARNFLEAHHIQGATGGSWRGGLYDSGELVALMVMRTRGRGHLELVRFATSAIVRGGHSRLLKQAIRELDPETITTFSNNEVSSGGLYEASGFSKDADIPPDYCYRVGNSRVHKFNYRKARFKSDPDLKYDPEMTERELADLNGLDRIYDSGKVRWKWVKTS